MQSTGASYREGGRRLTHLVYISLLSSLRAMQQRRPSIVRSSPKSEKLDIQNFMQIFPFKKILTFNLNFLKNMLWAK